MKKLVLAAAVLLGGMAASQAGIDFSISIGHSFPHPERVVISRPCEPVVVAPAPVCAPRPVVVAPACPPPAPVCHEPVVYREPAACRPVYRYEPRYSSYDHRRWQEPRGREYAYNGQHHEWDRGGWNDRGYSHGGYRR